MNQEWDEYEANVRNFRRKDFVDTNKNNIGAFTIPWNEQLYYQCCSVPLPPVHVMLPIRIQLNIYIIRQPDHVKCSDDINETSVSKIVQETNAKYWTNQTNIIFEITIVREISLNDFVSREHHDFLIASLYDRNHNPRGNKTDHPFHTILIPSFCQQYINSTIDNILDRNHIKGISICFMDCIGTTLQGICVRNNHLPVVFLGERSTKGYTELTKRPHTYLAKTLGHELGHALSLQHTRDRTFSTINNGEKIPQAVSGKPNLMEGGIDRMGGGGYHLEDWQICLAREYASKHFCKTESKKDGL